MQVDSVWTSLTSHFTANSKYLLLIYHFHCIIDNPRSTVASLSIKALTMTLLNRSYFFTLSFQCMSGTDASESIRSIAGGWGSVFCRLIILQLAAKKKKKQAKSPLNKKQATHALCKQSSTHLGRRSDESNWLAHAIEQHLPISSDCTKLLVAVCSYGQGLSIDMLSLLGGALFISFRPPAVCGKCVHCRKWGWLGRLFLNDYLYCPFMSQFGGRCTGETRIAEMSGSNET